MELALSYRGDAYRVVYALQIGDDVRVVHAFQKKSKLASGHRAALDVVVSDEAIEGDVEVEDESEIVRGSGNVFRVSVIPSRS